MASDLVNDLEVMTTQDLRRELVAGFRIAAETVLRLARIVHILERRGEDLSALRLSFIPILRLVASGQLVPDAVVKFAGNQRLLGALSALPTPDQQRLCDGDKVSLLVYCPDGSRALRQVDPESLTPEQFSQAFAPHHIRTQDEQQLILDQRRAKAVKADPDDQKLPWRLDKKRKGIVVGKVFVSLAELLSATEQLQPGKLKAEDRASRDESDEDEEPYPDLQLGRYRILRERIANHLLRNGLVERSKLALQCDVKPQEIGTLINHEWFQQQKQMVGLSDLGKAAVG